MVAHRAISKTSAKRRAIMLRKKGLSVSVYKKKKGYGVSSTR